MDGRLAKQVVSKEGDSLAWFATLPTSPFIPDIGVKRKGLRVRRVGIGEETFEFIWSRAWRRNNEAQTIPLTCPVLLLLVVIVMVVRRLETWKTGGERGTNAIRPGEVQVRHFC